MRHLTARYRPSEGTSPPALDLLFFIPLSSVNLLVFILLSFCPGSSCYLSWVKQTNTHDLLSLPPQVAPALDTFRDQEARLRAFRAHQSDYASRRGVQGLGTSSLDGPEEETHWTTRRTYEIKMKKHFLPVCCSSIGFSVFHQDTFRNESENTNCGQRERSPAGLETKTSSLFQTNLCDSSPNA